MCEGHCAPLFLRPKFHNNFYINFTQIITLDALTPCSHHAIIRLKIKVKPQAG